MLAYVPTVTNMLLSVKRMLRPGFREGAMADWQQLAGTRRGPSGGKAPCLPPSVRAADIHILNYTVLGPARLLL